MIQSEIMALCMLSLKIVNLILNISFIINNFVIKNKFVFTFFFNSKNAKLKVFSTKIDLKIHWKSNRKVLKTFQNPNFEIPGTRKTKCCLWSWFWHQLLQLIVLLFTKPWQLQMTLPGGEMLHCCLEIFNCTKWVLDWLNDCELEMNSI